MNRVDLIGNLARDPEQRTTSSGKSVVNIRVITESYYKGKTTTEGHNLTVWNEFIGRQLMNRCKKGTMIQIVGKLENRSWEKDGETRYGYEIVVTQNHEFMILRQPSGEAPAQRHEDDIPY